MPVSRSLGQCQAGAEGKRTRHLGDELETEKDRRNSLNKSSRVRTEVVYTYLGEGAIDSKCIQMRQMWSSLYATVYMEYCQVPILHIAALYYTHLPK